jgi:cytochrome d ubiquinol oxidase subunit II
MLLGIVLRGASFVFRTYDGERAKRRWGRRFAAASAVTPLLLGVIVGAITAPLPPVREDAWFWSTFIAPWLGPLPLATGVFALAQFAFLAAVYLTVEAEQDAELAEDFRRRALHSAVALGGAAALVLAIAAFGEAPEVARGLLLSRWALPFQLATGVFAVATIALLWRRAYRLARLSAAAQVALILLGWGLAMYPYLIAGSLTIRAAASPEPVLALLLWVFGAGLLVLIPALVYLLRTFKGPLFRA